MEGKYILISGSAGSSCPADSLDLAIRFVESFTEEVLRLGGGVVVLAGGEESTVDKRGVPRIFDWVVLRRVARYAESTTESPRTYARVIMSDEAPETKIDSRNLELLRNLEQRSVVERHHIRREVFTGGTYRNAMVISADAMLAIGGGKGTYSSGTEMIAAGKPVLPIDIQLGSIVDDGDGAVALHREMMATPDNFFPHIYSDVANKVGLLGLERGVNSAETVARVGVEMLNRELEVIRTREYLSPVKRRLANVRQFVKTLPLFAAAIKVIDFLRNLLN